MIIMSVNDYVKYSFLDVVGDYVKEMGISNIAELDNPKYNNAFERAVERIRNSVDNKLYIPNLEEPNTEIISFLISTMLLKLSNNIRLIVKFMKSLILVSHFLNFVACCLLKFFSYFEYTRQS